MNRLSYLFGRTRFVFWAIVFDMAIYLPLLFVYGFDWLHAAVPGRFGSLLAWWAVLLAFIVVAIGAVLDRCHWAAFRDQAVLSPLMSGHIGRGD